MSHYLPVYSILVKKDELPTPIGDAIDLCGLLIDDKEKEGKVWVSASRNWWLNYALQQLATAWKIDVLNYLFPEDSHKVVFIESQNLDKTIAAMETFLDNVKSDSVGTLSTIKDYIPDSLSDFLKGLEQAVIAHDLDDWDKTRSCTFFSFVKTQLHLLKKAKEEGTGVLSIILFP